MTDEVSKNHWNLVFRHGNFWYFGISNIEVLLSLKKYLTTYIYSSWGSSFAGPALNNNHRRIGLPKSQ